jgi:uncharacterized phage protein (TIGR02218 family)
MAFETYEEGTEGGQPIELYEFHVGTNITRLTSSENDVTLPSTALVYTREAISRGNLREEINDPAANRLEVRMPTDNEFVEQFRSLPPGQKATLTVYRMHRSDLGAGDDKVTIFKGTVRNISYTKDGRIAVVQVLPLTSSYSKVIPRRTFQNGCNHMLYDGKCGISKDSSSWKYSGTVLSVSGDVITVSGAGAFSVLSDFFVSGYMEWESDYRTIVAESGDALTLMVPFFDPPGVGDTVICRAGCKGRLVTDCQNKFSNSVNFGGFVYVPKKNPFRTGLD